MPDDISPAIIEFVQSRLDSVEQLSVLLLMHLQPQRTWTVEELTRELRSSEVSIQHRLDGLYKRHVLKRISESGDKHTFSPVNDEIAAVIEQLALVNLTKPYRIIELIYSRRSNALQDFADAFKIKGEKE